MPLIQSIQPKESKFEPITVSYWDDSHTGLSNIVKNISLHHYDNGMQSDIYLTVYGEAKEKVQAALAASGLSSADHFVSGSSNHVLRISNINPDTALMGLVTALTGEGSGVSGVLGKETANSIIRHELARICKTAVEAGMMTTGFISVECSPDSGKEDKPLLYVRADIQHPLSPVLYMDEDGEGRCPITRVGCRPTHCALLIDTLKNAGIRVRGGVDEKRGDYFVTAIAEADETAQALEKAGILPDFLATPIIQQTELRRSLTAGRGVTMGKFSSNIRNQGNAGPIARTL